MTTVTAEKSGVVGVRFQKLGKMYHFTASSEHDINPGDHVIVETRRGRQLGQVIADIEPGKQHQKGKLASNYAQSESSRYGNETSVAGKRARCSNYLP